MLKVLPRPPTRAAPVSLRGIVYTLQRVLRLLYPVNEIRCTQSKATGPVSEAVDWDMDALIASAVGLVERRLFWPAL